MKNKKIHIPEEMQDWFESLSAEEKKEVQAIWKASGGIKTRSNREAGDKEIEQELQAVIRRLKGGEMRPPSRLFWKNVQPVYRWAAAAAVLIAVSLGTYIYHQPIVKQAPYGEIMSVSLPDNSLVELNSGASIRYARNFGTRNRHVILEGEGYFDVKAGEKPFVVETHNALVNVVGTKFNVRSWPTDSNGETFVVLDEGNVEFASRFRPELPVKLEPGQLSRLSFHDEEPQEPAPAPMDAVLAWRNKGIALNNQPMSVIFDELERRFNKTIETDDPEIANELTSIYLRNPESMGSVLYTLSRAGSSRGFTIRETDSGFHVSRR